MTSDNTYSTYQAPGDNSLDAYNSGTWRAPEGYKDLLILILLMFIPFYFAYWIYKMTEYTNVDEQSPRKNPLAQVFLFVVPFYGLYWYWLISKKLFRMGEKVGLYKDNAAITMIIEFFISPILAALILQDQFNRILCVKAGATINATGQGKCKNCYATFPNDAIKCPRCGSVHKNNSFRHIAPFIIATILGISTIASFMYGFYLLREDETSNTTPIAEETVEMTAPRELMKFPGSSTEETNNSTSSDTKEITKASSELKQGPDGKWGLYDSNGNLDNSFNGLAQNKNTGDWYFLMNGYVSWGFDGLARNNDMGQWFYVENGKVRFDQTGDFTDSDGNDLYLKNGQVIDGVITTFDGSKVTIKNGKEVDSVE